MSKVCKECGGTGIAINNLFCKCDEGKTKKHMQGLKLKKEMQRAQSNQEKYNEPVNDPIKEMQNGWADQFKFNVGDWVEHGSLIGVVYGIDIAGGKIRFNGYKEKDREPRPGDMPQGWVNASKVKLAPLERFDNADQMLIDLALATGDKIWFEELTK